MSVLIIDNYDSFTYNLFQAVGKITGDEPIVHRNDALSFDALAALSPSHIIISPGPGRPDVPRDFGVCGRVITDLGPQVPLLGVCLGHQGIIHFLGGRVVRAPTIVHGKMWTVTHDGAGLFEGLPPTLDVMRYHSLIGERDSLPDCLAIAAETSDGIVMAVQHKDQPTYGLQFHPESVGTPDGERMLARFLAA